MKQESALAGLFVFMLFPYLNKAIIQRPLFTHSATFLNYFGGKNSTEGEGAKVDQGGGGEAFFAGLAG